MSSIWQRIRGGRKPELTCVELVEIVTDYVEGAMTDAERARFDSHLSDCDGCTSYVEQMRVTIATVGRIEAEDLSETACAELLAAFRGLPRT